jgi:hypothetical protein
VDTHAGELDEAMGGRLHRLLESRDPTLAASFSMGSVVTAASPPVIPPPWVPFACLSSPPLAPADLRG